MYNVFCKKFFTCNSAFYKCLRTVVQVVLGFVVDNLAMIVAQTQFDATTQTLIVGVVMAVLAPLMSKLGVQDEKARNQNA